MSTSLTSSGITIGSYSATAIAGSSSSASNYSTLATTAWVDAHDSVGSSPSLTNYVSYSKIGHAFGTNTSLSSTSLGYSDLIIFHANNGRSNNTAASFQLPASGTWNGVSVYGLSNIYGGFDKGVTGTVKTGTAGCGVFWRAG